MALFEAKMHQITALPRTLAGFQGPTFKGKEWRGEVIGQGKGGRGKEGREGKKGGHI